VKRECIKEGIIFETIDRHTNGHRIGYGVIVKNNLT